MTLAQRQKLVMGGVKDRPEAKPGIRRAAAEIGRLWAAIERSVKAIRGTASASGAMH